MKSALRTAAVLLLGLLLPPAALLVYWQVAPDPTFPPVRPIETRRPEIPTGPVSGAGSISGSVEASEGGALGGAEIWAIGSNLLRTARADGGGAFRIEGLPEDSYLVLALAPRRLPASIPDVRPGSGLVRLRAPLAPEALREPDRSLPPPNGFVSGRLARTDGGPLPGFVAALLARDSKGEEIGPIEVAPAGFDGFYDFPPIPPGSYRLVVLSARRMHDARLRFAEKPVEVAAAAETTADLSFACAELRGTVLDGEDRPVAGAIVRFLLECGNGGRCEAGLSRTREDGSFRILELTGGRGELEVHAPGFRTHLSAEEIAVGATRDVRVVLPRAAG